MAAAKGIGIRDFNDLMANPEVTLFEGRYRKDTPEVAVQVRRKDIVKTAAT